MATVLTVDDESGIRDFLAASLEADGHEVVEAADGGEALRALESRPIDLMFLDLRMPGALQGMDVLRRARAEHPEMQVVVLTATGTIGIAMEAVRLGVFDFLEKPIAGPDAVRRLAARALTWRGRAAAPRRELATGDERPAAGGPGPVAPPAPAAGVDAWGVLGKLRSHNLYRVAGAYAAVCFAALQVAQLVLPVLPVPGATYSTLVQASVAGFPLVLALGWVANLITAGADRARARHLGSGA